jgi:GxGYxYP putative glycoside hydrolase C-terminal domain/GxGYxYP third domain/GxGYxYP_N second domain
MPARRKRVRLPGRRVVALIVLAAILALPRAALAASPALPWIPGRALPRLPPPAHLDVVDLDPARCSCGGEDALMLATLEGVVNRLSPSVYLLQRSGTPGESPAAWLDDLGVPSTVTSEWDLVARDRQMLSGIVEYDPRVPETINLATTIAGLRSAVVAGPALTARLRSLGLPVLENLADEHFTGRLDVDRWALVHVWPMTTHRMLLAQPPGPDGWLRDEAVAARAMVVWLDPTVPEEAQLLDAYLAGLPPDSPYLGWFPGGVRGEQQGVLQLSRHAVYAVAADRFANLTVFSGAIAPSLPPPPVPPPPLQNRIYLTITLSDGDNLAYDQHRMRVLWDDPSRGQVPLNWTLQPLLVDAAPAILHHYQVTATDRDLLLAGPSGAGYMYPDGWPAQDLGAFAAQTGDAMQAAGLRSLAIYNSPAAQLQYGGAVARRYQSLVSPDGVVLDRSDTPLAGFTGDTAVVSGPLDCPAGLASRLATLARGWDGRAPRFVAVSAIAWCSTPGQLAGLVRSLDPRVVAVRGDQLFALMREARRSRQ